MKGDIFWTKRLDFPSHWAICLQTIQSLSSLCVLYYITLFCYSPIAVIKWIKAAKCFTRFSRYFAVSFRHIWQWIFSLLLGKCKQQYFCKIHQLQSKTLHANTILLPALQIGPTEFCSKGIMANKKYLQLRSVPLLKTCTTTTLFG